jgi:glutamate synthase domain-containing protein 2
MTALLKTIRSASAAAAVRLSAPPAPSPSTLTRRLQEERVLVHGPYRNLYAQADTGGILLAAMGNPAKYPIYWDHLLLDASQVTNPSIDPLREPMELRTYLGKKPDHIEVVNNEKTGKPELKTALTPQLTLEYPFIFSAMSYGALNLNAHRAMAAAAEELGTIYNTGEGGLHKDLYKYGKNVIVQVASGRFGVSEQYLNAGVGIEIKIGQGAKPGIGGHLPGEKVDDQISETRMIPMGSDAISPAPHHDIYSIEDLRQLIYALKEATNYTKPVSVKIAAVHHIAAIASGVARAGADIITIDGFRGGTGAAPQVIRDNVGIPMELASGCRRLQAARRRHPQPGFHRGRRRGTQLRRRHQGHRPGRRCHQPGYLDPAGAGMHPLPALLYREVPMGHHHQQPLPGQAPQSRRSAPRSWST